MASPRFPARLDDERRIVPVHPERLSRYKPGREVWVSVHDKPALVQRSAASNNYLWGIVYGEIARATGNDPDDIHYGLKREAVRRGILDPTYVTLGDLLIEGEPTTVTDSETFHNYVQWIRSEAQSGRLTGSVLIIPEPNSEADLV